MSYITDPVTGDQIYVRDEPELNPEDQPGGYYLPPDAEVTERDARGNPIAYKLRGETYYPPGSISYELGFRTESERIRDGGERQVGLSQGSRVPEGTIVLTDDKGKPVRRITPDEVSKAPGHYGEQARLGLVKYPVKDFVGREKLLKEDEYTKLAEAKTDTDRLSISKKLGLVPENWTLDDYTGETERKSEKKQAAEAFISQQEAARFERTHTKMGDGQYISNEDWKNLQKDDPEGAKILGNQGFKAYDKYVTDENKKVAENNAAYEKQQRALSLTARYTEGDKVNVVGFLRQYGDSGEQALKDLGYDDKDVKAWRQMSKDPRYVYADFSDKVATKRAEILKGLSKEEAKIAGPDLYTYADGKARAEVLKTYSQNDQKVIQGQTFARAMNIVVPYVETSANWEYMSSKERRQAVAFETAVILVSVFGPELLGKAPKWLKSLGRDTTFDDISKMLKEARKKPKPPSPDGDDGRSILQKGAEESRAKYEREQKAALEEYRQREKESASIAVKERERIPAQVKPQPESKPAPKKAVEPTPEPKPSPFSLRPKPSVKTEVAQRVEVKPDIRQIPREGIRTDVRSRPDVQSRRIEETLTKSSAFEKATPKEWQQIREAIQSGVNAHQKAVTQGATQSQAQTAAKQAVREALQSKTSQQTRQQVRQQVQLITRQVVKTDLLLKVRPRPPVRLPSSDRAARRRVLESKGAIAWRQGKVAGQDRWDVIVNPYSKDEDYVMVLGAPPKGAALATGAMSAYRTAKVLYGKAPKRDFSVDSGFQDVKVDAEGKKVSLIFTPDPKGLTRGDIMIGKRQPKITARGPRISASRPRISR